MAQVSSPDSPSKLDHDEDIMQYYVVDGVRLPPFCRGKMEEIINFPVREDDVWILSYPRAGKLTGIKIQSGTGAKFDSFVNQCHVTVFTSFPGHHCILVWYFVVSLYNYVPSKQRLCHIEFILCLSRILDLFQNFNMTFQNFMS